MSLLRIRDTQLVLEAMDKSVPMEHLAQLTTALVYQEALFFHPFTGKLWELQGTSAYYKPKPASP